MIFVVFLYLYCIFIVYMVIMMVNCDIFSCYYYYIVYLIFLTIFLYFMLICNFFSDWVGLLWVFWRIIYCYYDGLFYFYYLYEWRVIWIWIFIKVVFICYYNGLINMIMLCFIVKMSYFILSSQSVILFFYLISNSHNFNCYHYVYNQTYFIIIFNIYWFSLNYGY